MRSVAKQRLVRGASAQMLPNALRIVVYCSALRRVFLIAARVWFCVSRQTD